MFSSRDSTVYFKDCVKVVYVVFTHSEHWLQIFLKRNFGHCYILTHDKYNWMKIDPTPAFLNYEVLPYSANQPAHLITTKKKDKVIRVILYSKDETRSFGWFGLRSCVVITKYMLGLPIHALTPYKLYNALLSLTSKQRNMYGIQNVQLIK